MLDLVGTPYDRFSLIKAHLMFPRFYEIIMFGFFSDLVWLIFDLNIALQKSHVVSIYQNCFTGVIITDAHKI